MFFEVPEGNELILKSKIKRKKEKALQCREYD